MGNAAKTLDDALHDLRGRTLSSVEFVHDYVQLRFDGPTLTAYTQPYLTLGAKAIFWGDPAYRNSLCALIGVQVEDTNVTAGKELTVHFQDGTVLKISLKDKDYHGPEALEFVSGPGPSWVV